MSVFWLLAAGLLVLVGWLVLPTLFGRTTAEDVDRSEVNRSLQLSELAKLDAARAADKLDEAAYALARSDLERRVLEAAQPTERAQPSHQPRLARNTAFMLMVALPATAVLGYRALGGDAVAIAQEPAAMTATASPHTGIDMATTEVPPVDQLTERLAQRLQQNPDDADGWLLLARSYHHLGRDAEARDAYEQAQTHGSADTELAALIAAVPAEEAMPPVAANTELDVLKARADADPNDGEAWLALAQAYRRGRDFASAGAAFEKARVLLPANADLLADYADALAAAQGRRLDGEPAGLIEATLRLDTEHPKALWLAATAALQQGDIARAKAHWRHLQRLLPEGSPDRSIIDRNLAALDDDTADTSPIKAALIRGRVDISPELRARVSADDTVFIFARAVNGPPMPLAVLRKQVRDLPFDFSLDDSLAMQPQLKLSGFDQVMLGARVSHSGTVTQQPGEPRGDFGPVPTRGNGVQNLLIDKTGS